MNPVEIDDAVSSLAQQPFEAGEFPFEFLRAFGNPETTIKRLRSGSTNQSDLPGAVLQRSNIHVATCPTGEVDATLRALRASPKTASAKARFILATDGEAFQAEDMTSGETVACAYSQFPDHFGFFLPLAGITTVPQVRESSFDIKATGRLNRLYVQLLTDNPEWRTVERRADMNHFMARLIFCFFAEDTDIFVGEGLFTSTIEQMTARDASDTHVILSEMFRAMDTKLGDREAAKVPRYANQFPYVNGQLFSGSTETPRFSKIGRSYLLHIGGLNWRKINPDIFGSMIQAVADDEERGALGMHYTSVPNILKVLNPLFLDDLRGKLEEAGDNGRKLLNLRNRIARIRVFDPSCGSGNFLVIAYKEMRAIEAEVNRRRGESDRRSDIPLTNFRGIELRDFPAEIARLALIIAEYQADVLYRGQQEALAEFLPLDSQNWITCGNALRLDWLSICPPTGSGVKVAADDLFETPLDQAEIDFENEGGETYVCGNPPYLGSSWQTKPQKSDLEQVASPHTKLWKSLDYVCGWFIKGVSYLQSVKGGLALVATNSVSQGEQVAALWPTLYKLGGEISFAHRPFQWSNLASNQAGVTVVVVGFSNMITRKFLFEGSERREVGNISAYLVPADNIVIGRLQDHISLDLKMLRGNMPTDGGNFLMSRGEASDLITSKSIPSKFIKQYWGAEEVIQGVPRACLWVEEADLTEARQVEEVARRFDAVRASRAASSAPTTRARANLSHRFLQIEGTASRTSIAVPAVTSEKRPYLPAALLDERGILSNRCYALYDAPLWAFSLVVSRMHIVWVGTVCGRLEMRFSYSNTIGWNNFPVPSLTTQNKEDLTRSAETILLIREAHFPANIADLYDPEKMPEDLRAAHENNDELLERIYIGRRFRNDTERLEKLFDLYTKMSVKKAA